MPRVWQEFWVVVGRKGRRASRRDTCLLSKIKSSPRWPLRVFFALSVVKGPKGTDLLPETSESATSHQQAGGGCQQGEPVIESFESDRDLDC